MKSLSITFCKKTVKALMPLQVGEQTTFCPIQSRDQRVRSTVVYRKDTPCGSLLFLEVDLDSPILEHKKWSDARTVTLWLSDCGQSGVLMENGGANNPGVDPDYAAAIAEYKPGSGELNEDKFVALGALL